MKTLKNQDSSSEKNKMTKFDIFLQKSVDIMKRICYYKEVPSKR